MTTTKNPTKKFLLQMLIGASVGAGTTAAFLALFGDAWIETSDGGTIIAMLAGLIYAVMGLFVGFGLAAPRAGARLLNVEDEEELRAERPVLRMAAISCVLIGLFLIVLAGAGDATSLIGREFAVFVALGSLAAVLILSVAMNKRTDELTRQVSLESSALTLYAALAIFGGWAVLARLGYVAWVSPVAFVGLLALLMLVATFIVSARKGMLIPR